MKYLVLVPLFLTIWSTACTRRDQGGRGSSTEPAPSQYSNPGSGRPAPEGTSSRETQTRDQGSSNKANETGGTGR